MTTELKEQRFVLCNCYKKTDCYCKQWNGKGDVAKITSDVKAICTNNNTDPDKCEFLVEAKPRQGCDWIWKTISGNPEAKTAVATPEKEPETKPMPKPKPLPKKPQSKTCVECGDDATHMIAGYKPTYLCDSHAEAARVDGFPVVEIDEEESA